MSLRVGALFAGYGGLELAVADVLDVELAWYAEVDKAASKIMARHWPGVPNLGDVTRIDWATVEPVDILTGGSPCQDISHAGKRAGMRPGTRSGLWESMREAIAVIQPRLVVWENVGAVLSASAHSDMEPCPGCVGNGPGEPDLRALGRVVGDLSSLWFDAWWTSLRASDVGACHGRLRVFLFATPAADPDVSGREGCEPTWRRHVPDRCATADTDRDGLQGVRRQQTIGCNPHGRDSAREAAADVTLLPTPAVNDMGAAYTPDEWDAWTEKMRTKHGNGNGHGKSLNVEAQRLLSTPRATRGGSQTETAYALGGERTDDHRTQGQVLLPTLCSYCGEPRTPTRCDNCDAGPLLPTPRATDGASEGTAPENALLGRVAWRVQDRWGEYAPAITRWERILGRPVPDPTVPAPKGGQRLNPALTEWMMGLPEGWVTGTPGVTRNDQLKACGNGVVPQQCAAALRDWLNTLPS